MMSFLAMLKLVPRWMWLGLAVLAVMVGLTRWHKGGEDVKCKIGYCISEITITRCVENMLFS